MRTRIRILINCPDQDQVSDEIGTSTPPLVEKKRKPKEELANPTKKSKEDLDEGGR